MRPRPFGRGIIRLTGDAIRSFLASMRPRPFGRGIIVLLVRGRHIRKASMRPRPFGRGIDPVNEGPPVATMLQ